MYIYLWNYLYTLCDKPTRLLFYKWSSGRALEFESKYIDRVYAYRLSFVRNVDDRERAEENPAQIRNKRRQSLYMARTRTRIQFV